VLRFLLVMLRNFVLFPRLPVELQNIIWQITLSEPRAISGGDCFEEWWHGRLVRFLSPVALHVCHNSRSLAKKILRRTTIRIPFLPGWRVLYINQTCDFVGTAKWNVQMNTKISDFIADTKLINRLVVSGLAENKSGFEKDMMRYFDQFPGLEEVVLTDRGRLYLVQKRDLPNIDCQNPSKSTSQLVSQVQGFFKDKGENIRVSCCWFDRKLRVHLDHIH
jgi:2EXR family